MKAHTVERQPPSSLKPGALVSRAKNDMSGVNSGNQICRGGPFHRILSSPFNMAVGQNQHTLVDHLANEQKGDYLVSVHL